jgi:hypothetical protein
MGKNQDPGSGINIPDPQPWRWGYLYKYKYCRYLTARQLQHVVQPVQHHLDHLGVLAVQQAGTQEE